MTSKCDRLSVWYLLPYLALWRVSTLSKNNPKDHIQWRIEHIMNTSDVAYMYLVFNLKPEVPMNVSHHLLLFDSSHILWRACLGSPGKRNSRLISLVSNRHEHSVAVTHDDVIKWKHFPRYWSFVRGIHRPHRWIPLTKASDAGHTGEFPSQRPVTRSFDGFCDLCLNQRLSKQPRRRWSETPSRSLCRHCNVCTFAATRLTWRPDL